MVSSGHLPLFWRSLVFVLFCCGRQYPYDSSRCNHFRLHGGGGAWVGIAHFQRDYHALDRSDEGVLDKITSLESLYFSCFVDVECTNVRIRCRGSLILLIAITLFPYADPFLQILFTAAAFPDSLLASSVRGFCTTLAALCFSALIGRWVDQAPSRLRPLLATIAVNRASVVLACLLWSLIVNREKDSSGLILESLGDVSGSVRFGVFVAVIVLGVCEKLSGIGNMISMERDWVPALAVPQTPDVYVLYDLTHLNAVMRRIDLMCKLFAPVVISLVITFATQVIGVAVVGAMSFLSAGVEFHSARQVWKSNARLRMPKKADETKVERNIHSPNSTSTTCWHRTQQSISSSWSRQSSQLQTFFATDVWIPSLSLAMLHFSALSYSATFITYLLNRGFSLPLITIARAASSIVEVSSTFVAPLAINYLAQAHAAVPPCSPAADEAEELLDAQRALKTTDRHAVGLARSGLWGITFQLLTLVSAARSHSKPPPTSLIRY